MNSPSDTLLNEAEPQVESAREESPAEQGATLVELGRVSDTKGGWFGNKADTGAGFTIY